MDTRRLEGKEEDQNTLRVEKDCRERKEHDWVEELECSKGGSEKQTVLD